MSTVLELIEEIQEFIPEDKIPNLFPVINRAIRILSKRLFLLESDVIQGDLSVSVFAEDSYAAATIAFVDGGEGVADTITDSASQFVIEGFVANMPIITTQASNIGPFKISTVAAGTITLVTTDELTTVAAGTSVTITSQDDFGYLPSDFWGLVGGSKPYISGYTWPLLPLPGQDTKLIYTSAGEPLYYEILGSKLYVTPATSSDITVCGRYWKKPTQIAKMEDTVPFDELFDDAIQQYIVDLLNHRGNVTPDKLSALQSLLFQAVDLVVPKRQQRAAQKMPYGIDYNSLM